MYRDLILKYKEFDLETALSDLQQWQDGLGNTLEDEVTNNVLDAVRDIIFDNCIFE